MGELRFRTRCRRTLEERFDGVCQRRIQRGVRCYDSVGYPVREPTQMFCTMAAPGLVSTRSQGGGLDLEDLLELGAQRGEVEAVEHTMVERAAQAQRSARDDAAVGQADRLELSARQSRLCRFALRFIAQEK